MKFIAIRTQRVLGIELLRETFVGRKLHRHTLNNQLSTINWSGHLHELNGRPVRIPNIDDAFSGIGSLREGLRFACGLPPRLGDFFKHRIEIVQNGNTVFAHTYGKKGTDRLWSFSRASDELWWPWGVDHDTAEAPAAPAELAAGEAVIRLTAVSNVKPAGDRFVDFVLLTTDLKDEYRGFKPYAVGSPFANEALDATQLFLRFKNTTDKPARLTIARNGHFQPRGLGERELDAIGSKHSYFSACLAAEAGGIHMPACFLRDPLCADATWTSGSVRTLL